MNIFCKMLLNVYKNKLFNVRHIFQTTMDYRYAFVVNNDIQCH